MVAAVATSPSNAAAASNGASSDERDKAKSEQSPYGSWIQSVVNSKEVQLSPRCRPPGVNLPVHDGRLAHVRKLVPSPPGSRGPPEDQKWFSKKCSTVIAQQTSVSTFDPVRVYMSCEFFKPCSLSFVRELVAVGGLPSWRGQTLESGRVVYKEGEVGTCMYVVARGTAQAEKDGKLLRTLGKGDHFGHAQVLGVLPRRFESVTAQTSLQLLEVTLNSITRLLKRTKADSPADYMLDDDDSQDASSPGCSPSPGATSQAAPSRTSHFLEQGTKLEDAVSGKTGAAYVYIDERRHFEREAVRLYLELGSASRQSRGGRNASKGKRPVRSTGIGLGSPPEMAQKVQDGDDALDEDAVAVHQASSRPTARTVSKATVVAQLAAASPQAGNGGSGVTSAESVQATAMTSPKEWRAQVRRMQVVLFEGDPQDGAILREKFQHRLVESMRSDMRRGYMMPAESVGTKRAGSSLSGSAGGKQKGRTSSMGLEEGAEGESTGDEHDDDDEDDGIAITDCRFMLDQSLLPPLRLLSPVQKQGLLRQSQEQVIAAKRYRRAVYKGKVQPFVLKQLQTRSFEKSDEQRRASPAARHSPSPTLASGSVDSVGGGLSARASGGASRLGQPSTLKVAGMEAVERRESGIRSPNLDAQGKAPRPTVSFSVS